MEQQNPAAKNPGNDPAHISAFSEWLDQRGDALADPQSFSEWLNQQNDAINE
jgi:hypothetical protein